MAGYHQAHDNDALKDARKDAGNWLKKLRTDAGITQLDLARACGYEYVSFMSQIEAAPGSLKHPLISEGREGFGYHP